MVDQLMSAKDIISLVADVMTLFGVSGFFAWSFVKKGVESRDFADIGVSIFALSVKTFLSFGLLLLLVYPGFFSYMFGVLLISDSFNSNDLFWNDKKPLACTFGYFVTALWFIPAAILSVSSVFTWSLDPFKKFVREFKRNQ